MQALNHKTLLAGGNPNYFVVSARRQPMGSKQSFHCEDAPHHRLVTPYHCQITARHPTTQRLEVVARGSMQCDWHGVSEMQAS